MLPSRLCLPPWLACCATAALVGCAAWSDVRGVATGTPQPAYELRGAKLETLQAEALRLCPGGFEITRSWQRYGQPSDTWWSKTAIQVTDFNGVGDRQAFLAIVCKEAEAQGAAAPAPAAASAPQPASAPAWVPVPAPLPMPTSSPPPVPLLLAPPASAPTIPTAAPASATAPAADASAPAARPRGAGARKPAASAASAAH